MSAVIAAADFPFASNADVIILACSTLQAYTMTCCLLIPNSTFSISLFLPTSLANALQHLPFSSFSNSILSTPILLLPSNPTFKPIEVVADNQFVIWGIVTYTIKKNRRRRN